MIALAVLVFAGLGTYAARSMFIVGVGDRALPPRIERALQFVGPAVLAALTASLLTDPGGLESFVSDLPAVVGTVVGIFVAWRTRDFVVSFVAALVAFYLLGAFV